MINALQLRSKLEEFSSAIAGIEEIPAEKRDDEFGGIPAIHVYVHGFRPELIDALASIAFDDSYEVDLIPIAVKVATVA